MNSEHIKKIKSIIHGNWYQLSYIESLQKTKSPYKSQEFLYRIVELRIDTNEIFNDSVLIIEAPGIHEGDEFEVQFRPGKATNSLQTNIEDYDNKSYTFELTYEIKGDTALYILKLDENNNIIQSIKYLRLPQVTESALQYMVNKTLISGIYSAFSSSEDTLNLSFENNGRLTGLSKYSSYYVITDFVADDYENVQDCICFDIQTKKQICYAFKILGDTILFFDYILNYETGFYKLGELRYRLERK